MAARTNRLWIAALVLSLIAVGVSHANKQAAKPRYGVDLEVTPVAGKAGSYESTVTVRDNATKATLMQSKVLSAEGQKAEAKATNAKDGSEAMFTVEIGDSGKMASYSVEYKDHDGVVSTYKSMVRLE